MPDPLRLDILRELREKAGLTQHAMARLCGLRGDKSYQTAGAWERGTMTPSAARRTKFIGYLWDHLGLREDVKQFEEIWAILVEEWGWEPISDKEWGTFTNQQRPPRQASAAIWEKLSQLEGTIKDVQENVSSTNHQDASPTQTDDSVTDKVWLVAPPEDSLPEPAPLPPKSKMPFRKNPFFTGREQALRTLAIALDMGNPLPANQVPTAAITGLGGIGKTQLACEFVHRYGQFFPGGVFWLSFDNPDAIQAEIAACGDSSALALTPDFDTRPLDEKVRLVQTALQEPTPRLLIFDNCEDPQLLHRWRPSSGGSRLLLTSRRGEWEPTLDVDQLSLGNLNRQESLQLLRSYLPTSKQDALDEIAENLGDLPLALHLAGSYLYRYRRAITPQQYLDQLHQGASQPNTPDSAAVLHHPSLQGSGISPTDHSLHVGSTFALSYEQLDPNDTTDHLARQTLLHLALLAPDEPVAYELLLGTLGLDAEEMTGILRGEETVTRLVELGLVEVGNIAHVRMHRLVAAYVCDAMQEDLPIAQTTIEEFISARLKQVNVDRLPLPLTPWQLHLRHMVDTAQLRADAISAALATEFGNYLYQVGDYSGAQSYHENALQIRLALFGEEHAATGESLNHLAYIYRDQADLKRSRVYFERALTVRMAILGEEHPDTIDTLTELGQLLWTEREVEDALKLLKRALDLSIQSLGKNHLITAECANNVAICLIGGIGDPHAAHPYLEQALRIREKQLGPDDPRTALIYNNMGYLLQGLSEYEDALRYYQQALRARQKTLGNAHADTAQTLNNLGTLHHALGNLQEAKTYLDQALATYINSVGNQHFRTSFCLNNLGLLHETLGDLDLARDYFARSLAIRLQVYRDDHPNTALSHNNLGMVFWRMGKLAHARPHLEAALNIRLAALGEQHPLTAQSYVHLALVLIDQRDMKQAQYCYVRALHIYAENPPPNDPNWLQLQQLLGT